MSKVFWLVGVVVLIGAMGYLAYESDDSLEQEIRRDAKSFVAKFNDYGEQIEIFNNPQDPKTVIVHEERTVVVPVTDDEGNISYENKTTTVEVEKDIADVDPTSDVVIEVQDRQTQKYKVCKRGHQCDVSGQITLIDPITKNIVDPPYGFSYIIRCVESYEENTEPRRTCESFEDRTQTVISYGDRTFLVTFVTDRDDPTGIYEVEISVNSKFTFPVDTNNDGIYDSEKPEVRTVIQELKLIE